MFSVFDFESFGFLGANFLNIFFRLAKFLYAPAGKVPCKYLYFRRQFSCSFLRSLAVAYLLQNLAYLLHIVNKKLRSYAGYLFFPSESKRSGSFPLKNLSFVKGIMCAKTTKAARHP